MDRDILEIKERQWQQEGKQGVDHPLGACDDNREEDNESCYPCKLPEVFSRDDKTKENLECKQPDIKVRLQNHKPMQTLREIRIGEERARDKCKRKLTNNSWS